MKINGCCNVNKHRDIKGSDKYVILYILLKFGSMERIKITFSERKDNLGIARKGIDYLSGSQGQSKAKEHTKRQGMPSQMSVRRTLQKIGDFDKLLYKSYESRRTNHDPTDS